MKKFLILLVLLFQGLINGAQSADIDTAVINKIRNEALNNSAAMDNLKTFCCKYGARLMWSRQYKKSAEWLTEKLKEIGITKVYNENINHSGKSWELKKYYANLVEPYTIPIIGNPKVWTPGTNGVVKSEIILFNPKSEEEFVKYKGMLKGKIVFISDPTLLRMYTNPFVTRFSDDSLKAMSNMKIATPEEKAKIKRSGR